MEIGFVIEIDIEMQFGMEAKNKKALFIQWRTSLLGFA
jgi:hypothetical protein